MFPPEHSQLNSISALPSVLGDKVAWSLFAASADCPNNVDKQVVVAVIRSLS